jgi:hypothetical protein
MPIAPISLSPSVGLPDTRRLGQREVARQAALLRPPGRALVKEADAAARMAWQFKNRILRAGWSDASN